MMTSNSDDISVYLACGLTHVPDIQFPRYVESMERTANAVESLPGLRVQYALRDSDPELARWPREERAALCFAWDRDMVLGSDLVIADVTFPSIGVGIELGLAATANIPIILTFCRELTPHARRKLYHLPGIAEDLTLQVGEGRVTLMALGLPTVRCTQAYDTPEEYPTVVHTGVSRSGWLGIPCE